MKPYYEESGIVIYHGDCREILPSLQSIASSAKSRVASDFETAGQRALPDIDLVLTDPPYVGMVGGYSFGDEGGVARKFRESISVGDPWNASFDWVPLVHPRLGAMIFCSYHSLPETATL